MFHLIVMACMAQGPCDERWLPAGDMATEVACDAGAAAVAEPWLAAHDMTGKGARCIVTAALPALALTEIAPGVLVHAGVVAAAAPENGGRIANLSVVDGGTAVAVVDPGGSRAEGEALLAAIRKRTGAPVTAVVLTHVHPDHILGAEVFREAGATIIANARLADALAARVDAYSGNYRNVIGDTAWHGSAFVAPDRGLSAREDLTVGGTSLRLQPVPTAHTDSDLTVWHADSGTLFTGDLVFRGLTPVLDGSLKGWLDWLGATPAPLPRHIVPGHGPVAEDWTLATEGVRDYLAALADAARAAIAEGVGLGEAVPAILRTMAPQAGGWADFEATTRRDAAAAFKELEWE